MNKELKIVDWEVDIEGNLGIQAISLVDDPAIESNFVFLSKTEKIEVIRWVEMKAGPPDKKMIFGPVLIPNKLIFRVDPKTGEEYYARCSAETIEQCREFYMKKHLQQSATLGHEIAVLGLTVVETWVKSGESDKSVELGFVEPIGTWFVGMKCDDETIWNEVKAGTFKGFSVEAFFAQNLSEDTLLKELESVIAELMK